MIFRFSNIGRFVEETEININGITVIAGKNGTGKSTISKLLYCVFDSFHNIDENVEYERKQALRNVIRRYDISRYVHRSDTLNQTVNSIISEWNDDSTEETLRELLFANGIDVERYSAQDISDIYKAINEVLNVSDDDIKENILDKHFSIEFASQLKHVNYSEQPGEIEALIRDSIINIVLDGKIVINQYIPLVKNIIYLDGQSPIDDFRPLLFRDRYSHDSNLKNKILFYSDIRDTVVEDILASERYKRIQEKLDETHIGNLVKEGNRDFEYSLEGLESNIKLENISAGTRILLEFKQLILNGYLEENGMIILDEPEVHMHPEWQYLLAEVIVLLQVELGINILINSHSADFILFVQYFSQKYKIQNRCDYYIIDENIEAQTSSLRNVTPEIDELYDMLGYRFIRVNEAMEWHEETE